MKRGAAATLQRAEPLRGKEKGPPRGCLRRSDRDYDAGEAAAMADEEESQREE
jgi:hypothetical protein